MARALEAFRVAPVGRPGVALESRSGAGVHTVRAEGGEVAYLKVTGAEAGRGPLAAARRELRFYRELAPIVPVRTPRLLGALDADDGVALLLAAGGEARDAASWTPGMWAALGRDLAALHGTPVPEAGGWGGRPDALLAALDAADAPDAADTPDAAGIGAFWAASLPRLPDLLDRRDALRARLTERQPPVLVHGDCHTDNVVHDAGSLVFCDWQETRIGRPASDLAFLQVRATPAGTTVPRALMDAYLDARPCDRDALERALVAEELAILLFLWPPFAPFNAPEAVERVRRRARALAARYLGEEVDPQARPS
ncbi:aminoglycoside phosphotransferase family protein [Streptomyces radicis]|uniref:Aminoglycoside phosphotransferase family protein n=2 Tax=Streptomyces radicis TaxID=1750517 RepID=A0A3A9VUH0_9ACTN|nr:aminoglycoside phosphotransferase family protein [Streptomyces radicis]RKN13938.1 aminoglycoside phosphotransferase family protein [Streptomyces radicis]